ncbi:MAG TPA: NADH-quinone oxidoreductase subunit J [Gemmatimonadaceae bacterium]|nr:NADH-quinone oxidoreductase subunit J [Gemmatimonadaceae bacterium]
MGLFYTFNFYLFGVLAIISAVTFVTRRSPVAAALWLVNAMFCLAALYVMMDAQFIGAIQVLVYAGAIMVVFLFVVMLLNLGQASDVTDVMSGKTRLAAAIVGLLFLAEMFVLWKDDAPAPVAPAVEPADAGVIAQVAAPLFRDYLLAFEITSVLLLAAIVGAVVLAKRRTT